MGRMEESMGKALEAFERVEKALDGYGRRIDAVRAAVWRLEKRMESDEESEAGGSGKDGEDEEEDEEKDGDGERDGDGEEEEDETMKE